MKAVISTFMALFLMTTLSAEEKGNIAKANKVFAKYKNSIVNISLVLSTEMALGGNPLPSREKNIETQATVYNKELFVTAYSNIDSTILQGITEFRGKKVEMKTSYKNVKMIVADGSEIPLKIVLVDKDQNIAFLAFDKSHSDYSKVSVVEAGFSNAETAKVLDQVLNISRLGKEFYRSPVVKVGHISALITKPKAFYLSTVASSGSPVYNMDGNLIGLSTLKLGKKNRMIVIPVKDIRKIAEQAEKKI